MKLTSRARHALRLALEVSRLGGGERPVRLSEVSEVTGISKKFLEQLAMALKSHGLLRGISGRKGGYVLARPADRITIGEVLKAIMGPISLAVCTDEPSECMSSEFCECRMIWLLLEQRIRAVLDEFTLADISDAGWLGKIHAELEAGGRGVPESLAVNG